MDGSENKGPAITKKKHKSPRDKQGGIAYTGIGKIH